MRQSLRESSILARVIARPLRTRRPTLLLSLQLTACFATAPHVEDEAGSADGSDAGSADGSGGASDSGAACPERLPPEGCVDALMNGGLDDWPDALALPPAWLVSAGTVMRATGESAACSPAMAVTAGSPQTDGVVWRVDQDFADVEIPQGGRAIFNARIELVAGVADGLRICSNADPASVCEVLGAFPGDGWTTVTGEYAAPDGPITLVDLAVTGSEPGQVVNLDDLHVWVCGA